MGSLRDLQGKATVFARLERLRLGLFGDCKVVGDGVRELRIDFGPGYRVYFGQDGTTVVLLLLGGSKGTQTKDIARAKRYWLDYKERKDA